MRFNDGQIPWWIFDKNRRVPETRALDYLPLMRLMWTSGDKPLSELMRCEGPLYDRLLEPLFLAALNIEPLHGSGKLAGTIIRETLALGGKACRPLIAPGGIGDAFVAPALRTLREQGVEVTLQHPLHALMFDGDRVTGLDFGEETDRARRPATASSSPCRPMPPPPWCRGCRRRRPSAASSTRISASIRRPARRA